MAATPALDEAWPPYVDGGPIFMRSWPRGGTLHRPNRKQPDGLEALVAEFAATRGLADEAVPCFLRRVIDILWESPKELQCCLHDISCLHLVTHIFLHNGDEEDLTATTHYWLLYLALRHELLLRDPETVREIVDDRSSLELVRVRARCRCVDRVMRKRARAELIAFAEELRTSLDPRVTGRASLDLFLGALRRGGDAPAPASEEARADPVALARELRKESFLAGFAITWINRDDGRQVTHGCYGDATLGWCVRRKLRHVTSVKCHRVVHEGRSLFLSASGRKTLGELGIEDGATLFVGGVSLREEDGGRASSEKVVEATSPAKRRTRDSTRRKKKKKTHPPPTYEPSGEHLARAHWQEHSKSMNPVLQELAPRLKQIRIRLDTLALKNTPPKVRGPNPKASDVSPAAPRPFPVDDGATQKAGRVAYPVLVGEASNLYRAAAFSQKHWVASQKRRVTLDLHGCSRDEARHKLDDSLPGWVETAMRGDFPWVLGVDIVCGGGGQLLSDVVREWIRANAQVANRPKVR